MTLSRKIVDAVEAGGAPSRSVEAEAGPHHLAMRLTAFGPVGLAFTGLGFTVKDPAAPYSAEALRAWGERLAARVTYLMEPLVVLEVDAETGEAVLRSRTPTPRGEHRSFYEIRLGREGTLKLHRLSFNNTLRIPCNASCQMTLEVLERLVDDLVASLD